MERQLLQRIQSIGQAVFLRIEAAFNAAFGDRLNPFYHLGEIAFFLFWAATAGSSLFTWILLRPASRFNARRRD